MNNADSPRAYNSGLVTAMLWTVFLALLTGLGLFPLYKATGAGAHPSTLAIAANPLMAFVRDVHHWASALVIVLGGLYVVVGVFRGVYKQPGQWLWITMLALSACAMLLQLSGHLLPYDAHAVRTAVVETGIAENAPVVGKVQAAFIRAGDSVGEHTLRRWYLAHVYLLTAAMAVFMFLAYRVAKGLGSGLGNKAWIVGPSFILLLLALATNAPLGPQAGPYDAGSFDVKPEWYVLPLHSLLNLTQSLHIPAFWGTMVVPGLTLIFLAALPWIDPSARKGVRFGIGAAGLLLPLALSIMSLGNMAPLVGNQLNVKLSGYLPKAPVLDPKKVALGQQLFRDQGCGDCHKIAGRGGNIGPDLSQEGSRRNDLNWHIEHLREPRSVNPGSTMPSFRQLPSDKLEALAQYMSSLKQESP